MNTRMAGPGARRKTDLYVGYVRESALVPPAGSRPTRDHCA